MLVCIYMRISTWHLWPKPFTLICHFQRIQNRHSASPHCSYPYLVTSFAPSIYASSSLPVFIHLSLSKSVARVSRPYITARPVFCHHTGRICCGFIIYESSGALFKGHAPVTVAHFLHMFLRIKGFRFLWFLLPFFELIFTEKTRTFLVHFILAKRVDFALKILKLYYAVWN